MKLWFERGAWASKTGSKKISAMDRLKVRRVAVIRHAALGDMVLVRPFLVEARKFFPNAEIILSLVSNYTYGAPTDLVDRVHVLHGSDQKKVSLTDRIKRAKELGQVDILFDLADTTRSRYLCFLTDATVKIGFPYRWYLRNLLFDAVVPRSDFVFEAVNMLNTLMLLGANPVIPPNFAWTTADRDAARENSTPYIVYFPFASVVTKQWPMEALQELIRRMSHSFPNTRHFVLSGNKLSEKASPLFGLFKNTPNIVALEPMELSEVLRILKNARIVVSSDTGIRNLAISTQTPTLGIFFSTVPFRYWPSDGLHQAIFEPDGTVPSVDRVFEACSAILNDDHASKQH